MIVYRLTHIDDSRPYFLFFLCENPLKGYMHLSLVYSTSKQLSGGHIQFILIAACISVCGTGSMFGLYTCLNSLSLVYTGTMPEFPVGYWAGIHSTICMHLSF